MKIATWNVERLKHHRDLSQIAEICNQIDADIFVLTETDSMLNLEYKSCFRSLPPTDVEVQYRSTENRVSIFTNYVCLKQHDTFDAQTAVCVELLTECGSLLVYGVIMGIFGNRHETYLSDLPRILLDIEQMAAKGNHLCVCGDFNCSFIDNYYFTKKGRTELELAFTKNDLKLLTREQPECIDHIAISRAFIGTTAVSAEEWNKEKALSDHKGIFIELKRTAQ